MNIEAQTSLCIYFDVKLCFELSQDEENDDLNESNFTESSFIRSVEKKRVERRLAVGEDSDDESEDGT